MSNILVFEEQFKKQVNDFLLAYGFTQQDQKYIREMVHQEPGQTVIINGMRQVYPGRQRHLVFNCKLAGKGEVQHSQDNIDSFEVVEYIIEVDGEEVGRHCECIYYDNISHFKTVTKQIFNLL